MVEKLRKIYLRFFPSTSPDVVGYKLYYARSGADGAPSQLTMDSPFFDLGKPVPGTDNKISIDIATIPALTQEEDVKWDLGIAAVDDDGHESMEVLRNVPLDLIAPAAPTGLEVVRL